MIGMDDKYLIVCFMMQERLNEIEQLYKQDVLGEYTASKDDPEHQTQSQIANVCDLSIIHKLMINVLLFSLHNDRRSRVPETHWSKCVTMLCRKDLVMEIATWYVSYDNI